MTPAELEAALAALLKTITGQESLDRAETVRLVELVEYLREHIGTKKAGDAWDAALAEMEMPATAKALDRFEEQPKIPYRQTRFIAALGELGLKPLVCVQGGGAKGAWQGGAISAILRAEGEVSVHPVAAIGSSAGALNAWLVSDELDDPSRDAFQLFWTRFPRRWWLYSVVLIPWSLLLLIPRVLFYIALGWLGRRRFPALVSFYAFRWVIGAALGQIRARRIPTYLVAAEVDHGCEESPGSPQASVTFRTVGENCALEVVHSRARVSAATALAASCCLPLIAPCSVKGEHYMDGGIHSNLPLDLIFDHGALGGNCVLLFVNAPVEQLNPRREYVDYRTVLLLHEVRDAQLWAEESRKQRTCEPMSSGANLPVFLIAPQQKVRSNLVSGFLCSDVARGDFQDGSTIGREFIDAMGAFQAGDRAALDRFLLESTKLPPIPSQPPTAPWWMRWVNFGWGVRRRGAVTVRRSAVRGGGQRSSGAQSAWGDS